MNLDSLGYTIEEQIFYGVYTLYLYPCTGTYNDFNIENIIQDELNEKNIEKVLLNINDLSYINKDYKNFYLPCIPETNIKLKCENIINNNNNKLLFPNSLIKFNLSMRRESEEFKKVNKYIGIKSGNRSSIIKNKNGKFYRLKGCGNEKQGFTLLKNENDSVFKKIEIRGCQFENNVFRELYYSYKINELLKKYKLFCSNIPIGYFKYDKNIKFIEDYLNKDNIIINEVQEIDKYCSIYETLGDRRLGCHLLKGIEIIIESIIELSINKFNLNEESYNNIYLLFNEKRRKNSIISENVIKRVHLPKGISIKKWCNERIYKNTFYEDLICFKSLINHLNNNCDLIKIKESSNFIEEWSKILEKKINYKIEHFKLVINDLLKMKDLLSNKSILEYILDIFIRVGYETAKIKRIFQDEDFNWGSYNGHSHFDIICSAHYNNFIILPGKFKCLLAPIDFDLAFQRKNFININKESKNFGKHDDLMFDKFLNREINTLLINIINQKDENYLNDNFKKKFSNLIYTLLNDSLIETYMNTFDKIECDYLEEYTSKGIIEILVKLTLILTYDRIS